jgi:hypothetical protein
MSNKSKLITSIILLIVSIGLLPTGFILNHTFVEQIYAGVPDALLGIQEEAVPSLEDQLPGLATPDVLLGVESEAVSTLESQLPGLAAPDVLLGVEAEALTQLEGQLPYLATPDVLLGLKAEIEATIPALINFVTSASVMNQTIYYAISFYGTFPAALAAFFNDQSWSTNTFGMLPINSISEVMTGGLASLGFTTAAQQAIMINGISIPGVADIPGLINDTTLGTGVGGFLEIYSATYDPITGPFINATIQTLYNATWTQLQAVAGYLVSYLFLLVPGFFQAQFGITVPVAEAYGFYFQWANGTLVEDGIDLSVFLETYDTELKGLEAGVPIATDISLFTSIDMWDPSNPLSFVNETGIFAWLDISYQATIQLVFGITTTQYLLVLNWLFNFITNLTPVLLFEETGYSVPELAQLAFYEQWANGTINGESVLSEGFLSQLDPSFAGAPYFEVGLPISSGLSLLSTMNLWDALNPYAFVNGDGLLVWYGAATNTTLQTLLVITFSLSPTQLLLLLNWLASFVAVRVTQLLEYETGYTVPELAQLAFYEQWANGTITGASILPEGFLSQLDPSFAGTPYFEVGLPTSSGLSLITTMNLWDEENPNAFVNGDGILVWSSALTNTTLQALLMTTFSITPAQLLVLGTWLANFVAVRVPQLLEYETGHTVPELAQLAFYEQWANGTINGASILPDGFLAELDTPILGPPFFEVGLTSGRTRLTVAQTALLWDEDSDFSLVSPIGIQKWYNAASDNATYTLLKSNNGGISDIQMTRILEWLPQFRDVIVNKLAKADLGLPMEPYDLGNAIVIGLSSAAGVLAVIGIVLLILSKRP